MEAPKKEIIIAVVFGLITGALVSLAVWMLKDKPLSLFDKKEQTKKEQKLSPTPTPDMEKKPLFITIKTPKQNPYSTTQSSLSIQGETIPGSTIIVSTEDKEIITESDKKGQFSIKLELKSEINQIYLTAIDKDKNIKTTQLDIYYEK